MTELRIETVTGDAMERDWRETIGGGDSAIGSTGADSTMPALSTCPAPTIILASNVDRLEFAQARGFVETERYVLPGDTIPFVTLRLSD